MKIFAKVWDFVFGVMLIAGATACGPFVIPPVAQFLLRNGSETLEFIVASVAFFSAPAGAAIGVLWRTGHRILPWPFIWGEAALGLILALTVFFFTAACYFFGNPNF